MYSSFTSYKKYVTISTSNLYNYIKCIHQRRKEGVIRYILICYTKHVKCHNSFTSTIKKFFDALVLRMFLFYPFSVSFLPTWHYFVCCYDTNRPYKFVKALYNLLDNTIPEKQSVYFTKKSFKEWENKTDIVYVFEKISFSNALNKNPLHQTVQN